jgi:hypothetical protein
MKTFRGIDLDQIRKLSSTYSQFFAPLRMSLGKNDNIFDQIRDRKSQNRQKTLLVLGCNEIFKRKLYK